MSDVRRLAHSCGDLLKFFSLLEVRCGGQERAHVHSTPAACWSTRGSWCAAGSREDRLASGECNRDSPSTAAERTAWGRFWSGASSFCLVWGVLILPRFVGVKDGRSRADDPECGVPGHPPSAGSPSLQDGRSRRTVRSRRPKLSRARKRGRSGLQSVSSI